MDEPGQDVKTFSNKMEEMARRISGTGSTTINLSTLVNTALIDCEVLHFQLKSTELNDMVDSNPKALSADEIIRTLNNKFWSLKKPRTVESL